MITQERIRKEVYNRIAKASPDELARKCTRSHPERAAAPQSRVVRPQRYGAWEKHRKATDEDRATGAGAHLVFTDLLQRILYLSGA
jgi:hypothetical protein